MTDAANPMVPWGPTLNRNLCDKMYDKRKLAAQDIEKIVRDLHPVDDRDRINNIITYLVDNFCQSPNAHNRKGGLIGMAAVAIGLGVNAYKFLSSVVPPIFRCLSDQEPRVRYYACESIYNIAKICRQRLVFSYFPEIFDILSRVRCPLVKTLVFAFFGSSKQRGWAPKSCTQIPMSVSTTPRSFLTISSRTLQAKTSKRSTLFSSPV